MEGVNADDALALQTINDSCTRLHIDEETQVEIRDMYIRVRPDSEGLDRDVRVAACIYVVCQRKCNLRTAKEIVSKFVPPMKLTNIKPAIKKINNLVTNKQAAKTGEEFVSDYCAYLQMTGDDARTAREAMQGFPELNLQICPVAAASAVVYAISQLSDNGVTLEDVSRISGVSKQRLAATFTELLPQLPQIIPVAFATPDRIAELLPPVV